MAFNLQKVLRALLFSSSQALSIKDVQNIFARFHEQATAAASDTDDEPSATVALSDAEKPAEDAKADSEDQQRGHEAHELQPEADPEAPSLKPAELEQRDSNDETTESIEGSRPETTPADTVFVEASTATAEVAEVEAVEESDAELYKDVPSLITAAQVREAMDAIAEELRTANDIYILIEGPAGYRIMTHPRFARWIRIMRDEPPPVKLTQSALETLAVVAYRQPVTRSQIESIRGVSAEAGLNKLMERELVYITGRADLPGRPLQYSTTDKFLEFVGVKSLVELPASDVLSPRQIDAWLQNAATSRPPADAEMGLPLEEGEGASPNLSPVEVEHSHPPFPPATDGQTQQQAEMPVETTAPETEPDVDAEAPQNEAQPDQEIAPESGTSEPEASEPTQSEEEKSN